VPRPSDPDLLVLLGLRLRGFADADELEARTGLSGPEVLDRLAALERDGLVRHRAGRVSGWTLTATGRATGERLLADELDAAGARGTVTEAYHRFLAHNAEMLAVCTAWQLREIDGRQVVNDHSDPDHDAAVVADLVRIDAAVQPVCARLAEALERFAGYGPRFTHALDRLRAGEGDWFTKPTVDSYHTVWFELHENLLATLGIPRGSEVSGPIASRGGA
jgi:DNA-binding Lrp family transcriptional regulator